MIAADDGSNEPEAGRHGEQHPHERPQKRPPKVERRRRLSGYDADARRHFPECLSAGCEGDQVPAVLHQQEGEERSFRQNVELRRRDAADLHREVDDDDVDGGEDRQVNHDRDETRADGGVPRGLAPAGAPGSVSVISSGRTGALSSRPSVRSSAAPMSVIRLSGVALPPSISDKSSRGVSAFVSRRNVTSGSRTALASEKS